MQRTDTRPDSFWTLILYGIGAIVALVALTSAIAGAFNPLLWAIVVTPLAALAYAVRRSD